MRRASVRSRMLARRSAGCATRYPDLPYSLAGFSFGSRVILSLGCELGNAARLIAIGFPTRGSDVRPLTSCAVPKFFISSTHDQFAPRNEMEALYAKIAEPKQMIWIEAEDHFFARCSRPTWRKQSC